MVIVTIPFFGTMKFLFYHSGLQMLLSFWFPEFHYKCSLWFVHLNAP